MGWLRGRRLRTGHQGGQWCSTMCVRAIVRSFRKCFMVSALRRRVGSLLELWGVRVVGRVLLSTFYSVFWLLMNRPSLRAAERVHVTALLVVASCSTMLTSRKYLYRGYDLLCVSSHKTLFSSLGV